MPNAENNFTFHDIATVRSSGILSFITLRPSRCAEDAFNGNNGLSSTPQQKAQAIRNYLKKGSC